MKSKLPVVLDSHYEKFIDDSVMSGNYFSEEDVILAALQLLEIEEKKAQLLQKELELGEKSPMIANFNAKNHLEKLHEKYL
jgi:antitoxin ParD1/3/4